MARRQTPTPDPTEINAETFASGLSDRFLHCRELGHNWQPHAATFDKSSGTYDRTLRCRNCRTERHQVLSSLGHVLSNAYTYAAGYMAANVTPGTLSRDVFRVEAVQRFLNMSERQAS